jgi:hypothetical protein
MRKIAYILTILMVAGILFYAFIQAHRGYNNRQIKKETVASKINIDYPVFRNPGVDQDIEIFINMQVSKFKKIAPPSPDDPRHYKNELNISFDKPFVSDKYISIVFYVMTYSGGAHPDTVVVTKNFDAHTGLPLKFADVCPISKSRIRLMILLRLLGTIDNPDSRWINQGVKKNDLDTFSLGPDAITFYFNQTEVAPYSQGIQKVTFHISELK